MANKNKILFILCFLFLNINLTADAKICISCSNEIPDSSNFCQRCLTPQPQNALVGQNNNKKEPREVILEMFSFIDDYAIYFNDLQYLNILGKMPELKTNFQNASIRYKNIEKFLPEECKILANIYAAKYQLFDGITNIMKNLRIDSGYRTAIGKSALLSISYYNKIIDQFRTPRIWDSVNISILKEQIKNVQQRIQKYQVTAKYIKLGETKVKQGENIMVVSINGNKALVMYMGPSATIDAVQGKISLKVLEKRTTWVKNNEFFFEDIPLKNY